MYFFLKKILRDENVFQSTAKAYSVRDARFFLYLTFVPQFFLSASSSIRHLYNSGHSRQKKTIPQNNLP